MTVLDKRAASGIETKGVWNYLVVTVVALAIGAGAGWGIDRLVETTESSPPAAYARYSEVGEHLDDIWRTGVIQQEAFDARQTAAQWRKAAELRGAAMTEQAIDSIATVNTDLLR